jgi:hypothetical protein
MVDYHLFRKLVLFNFTKKNLNIVMTLTGAGDLFAAGFLHGWHKDQQNILTKECLEKVY